MELRNKKRKSILKESLMHNYLTKQSSLKKVRFYGYKSVRILQDHDENVAPGHITDSVYTLTSDSGSNTSDFQNVQKSNEESRSPNKNEYSVLDLSEHSAYKNYENTILDTYSCVELNDDEFNFSLPQPAVYPCSLSKISQIGVNIKESSRDENEKELNPHENEQLAESNAENPDISEKLLPITKQINTEISSEQIERSFQQSLKSLVETDDGHAIGEFVEFNNSFTNFDLTVQSSSMNLPFTKAFHSVNRMFTYPKDVSSILEEPFNEFSLITSTPLIANQQANIDNNRMRLSGNNRSYRSALFSDLYGDKNLNVNLPYQLVKYSVDSSYGTSVDDDDNSMSKRINRDLLNVPETPIVDQRLLLSFDCKPFDSSQEISIQNESFSPMLIEQEHCKYHDNCNNLSMKSNCNLDISFDATTNCVSHLSDATTNCVSHLSDARHCLKSSCLNEDLNKSLSSHDGNKLDSSRILNNNYSSQISKLHDDPSIKSSYFCGSYGEKLSNDSNMSLQSVGHLNTQQTIESDKELNLERIVDKSALINSSTAVVTCESFLPISFDAIKMSHGDSSDYPNETTDNFENELKKPLEKDLHASIIIEGITTDIPNKHEMTEINDRSSYSVSTQTNNSLLISNESHNSLHRSSLYDFECMEKEFIGNASQIRHSEDIIRYSRSMNFSETDPKELSQKQMSSGFVDAFKYPVASRGSCNGHLHDSGNVSKPFPYSSNALLSNLNEGSAIYNESNMSLQIFCESNVRKSITEHKPSMIIDQVLNSAQNISRTEGSSLSFLKLSDFSNPELNFTHNFSDMNPEKIRRDLDQSSLFYSQNSYVLDSFLNKSLSIPRKIYSSKISDSGYSNQFQKNSLIPQNFYRTPPSTRMSKFNFPFTLSKQQNFSENEFSQTAYRSRKTLSIKSNPILTQTDRDILPLYLRADIIRIVDNDHKEISDFRLNLNEHRSFLSLFRPKSNKCKEFLTKYYFAPIDKLLIRHKQELNACCKTRSELMNRYYKFLNTLQAKCSLCRCSKLCQHLDIIKQYQQEIEEACNKILKRTQITYKWEKHQFERVAIIDFELSVIEFLGNRRRPLCVQPQRFVPKIDCDKMSLLFKQFKEFNLSLTAARKYPFWVELDSKRKREIFYNYMINRRINPLIIHRKNNQELTYILMGSKVEVFVKIGKDNNKEFMESAVVKLCDELDSLKPNIVRYFNKIIHNCLGHRSLDFVEEMWLHWQEPMLMLMADTNMTLRLNSIRLYWEPNLPFTLHVQIFKTRPVIKFVIILDLDPICNYHLRNFNYSIQDESHNIRHEKISEIIYNNLPGMAKIYRTVKEILQSLEQIYVEHD